MKEQLNKIWGNHKGTIMFAGGVAATFTGMIIFKKIGTKPLPSVNFEEVTKKAAVELINYAADGAKIIYANDTNGIATGIAGAIDIVICP